MHMYPGSDSPAQFPGCNQVPTIACFYGAPPTTGSLGLCLFNPEGWQSQFWELWCWEPHCCALEIMIVTHTLTSQNCYENQWKNYYFYLKNLFYGCSVCVSTCMHTHGNAASTCLPVGMCIWLQYLQKLKEGIRFPLDLKLHVVMNWPMWVLETELGSLASTVPGLNPWAVSSG